MRPVSHKSDKFEISDTILGTGSFSIVKLGKVKAASGEDATVAIKITQTNSSTNWTQCLAEISFLTMLEHPNIVKIKDWEIRRTYILMGLELGNMSLRKYIQCTDQNMVRDKSKMILTMLMDAVNYLHSNFLIHNDIKPENILVITKNNDITIRLMDFGLCHISDLSDFCNIRTNGGTLHYMAPEKILGRPYTHKADYFSVGLVLYALIFKGHPFLPRDPRENYKNIIAKKPEPRFPNDQGVVPDGAIDFLKLALRFVPDERKIQRHAFFEVRRSGVMLKSEIKPLQELQQLLKEGTANVVDINNTLTLMQLMLKVLFSGHEEDISEALLKTYMVHAKAHLSFLINKFRVAYDPEEWNTNPIMDEYHDYLIEVTKSTPKIAHAISIGYEGEMYYRENRRECAFDKFVGALLVLNRELVNEHKTDRKTIIGRKMKQWTQYCEEIKKKRSQN